MSGPVVVVHAPRFDSDLGFEEGTEFLDVEQLVADAPVEALDEGVLPGRAGLDLCRPVGTSPGAPTR